MNNIMLYKYEMNKTYNTTNYGTNYLIGTNYLYIRIDQIQEN